MAKIGIFDSGVGGLSVFKEIKKRLPKCSFIYYGDNANCPYGIKGPDFILQRSREIAHFLESKGVDIIVVACNTATSYAVKTLDVEMKIPVIGTVPGVKPAASETKTGVVGVLATFGTLNAPLYNRIRDRWGAHVEVVEHIGQGYVELVEALDLDSSHAKEVVKQSVEPLVKQGADIIVLGCTHYPFLKKTIEEVANEIKPDSAPIITVYDPAPAIARHVEAIIMEKGLDIEDKEPTVILLSSGSDEILKKLYELSLN